jgi:hypothetical protein
MAGGARAESKENARKLRGNGAASNSQPAEEAASPHELCVKTTLPAGCAIQQSTAA